MNRRIKILCALSLLASVWPMASVHAREYSVAGFYQTKEAGAREVFNFNSDWKFAKWNEPAAANPTDSYGRIKTQPPF